nr:carboxylesterase family protein [Acidobacteriota bacterium]
LAGWNRDEGNYREFFGKDEPSRENYKQKMRELFGDSTVEELAMFPGETDEQMKASAGLLSTADFIAFGTWQWIEMHGKTAGAVIYRYEFDQAPPQVGNVAGNDEAPAYHSAEIEYVFGTLDSKKLPWRAEDYKLSEQIGTYWTNFAKTGNPNGSGVTDWPLYEEQSGYRVMHLAGNLRAIPDDHRKQFEFLDTAGATKSKHD